MSRQPKAPPAADAAEAAAATAAAATKAAAEAAAAEASAKAAEEAAAAEAAAAAKAAEEAAAAEAAASAGRSAAANAGPSPESTIVVQGPGKGRRRAGFSFGVEPVIIPLADLTEAQLLAIQSDPELMVAVHFNPETV